MKNLKPYLVLCGGLALPQLCPAQAPSYASKVRAQLVATTGQIYKKRLPEDLPKSKLLLIKFSPVQLPSERPKDMPKSEFKQKEHHNSVFAEANQQLLAEAAKYPYPYHITTQDSIAYYREHGYKYLLFHNSFNSWLDGNYSGTNRNGATYVDLYLRNLTNNDLYVIDDFSETFIYYYKGLVGMLLKKTEKQFKTSKS